MRVKAQELREALRKGETDLWVSRKRVDQKEVELNKLKEEIKYKNQQLASRDLGMESYPKGAEERIF